MDSGFTVRIHYIKRYCIPLYTCLFYAFNAGAMLWTDWKWWENKTLSPLDSNRKNVAFYACCRHSERRPTLSYTPRIRLSGYRTGSKGQPKRQKAYAWWVYHFATNGKKRVLMAGKVVAAQGFRGLFHLSYRNVLEQTTHYGGISQLHRNGRWHIRSTGLCREKLRCRCHKP